MERVRSTGKRLTAHIPVKSVNFELTFSLRSDRQDPAYARCSVDWFSTTTVRVSDFSVLGNMRFVTVALLYLCYSRARVHACMRTMLASASTSSTSTGKLARQY